MIPSNRPRLSFGHTLVATSVIGIVSVWAHWGGQPVRHERAVDTEAPVVARAAGTVASGGGAPGRGSGTGESDRSADEQVLGSRDLAPSGSWATASTGITGASAGDVTDGEDRSAGNRHRRMRHHGRGLTDDTATGDASGSGVGRLVLRAGRAPGGSQANGGKPGSNPNEATRSDKAPAPVEKAVQAMPGTEPTENAPTDEVIPIKAGDMDLDSLNHAKLRRNGDVFMFANSTLSTNVDLPSDLKSLSIFAHADQAGGEWPHLIVSVNGEQVGEVIVNSAIEKKFYVPVQVDSGAAVISVTFVNDYNDPTTFEDRNVYLNKIKVHVAP